MRKIILPTVVLAAFIVFFLVLFRFVSDGESDPDPTDSFAVVVYGSEDSERWKAMEQGIQQACSELGIPKPVVVFDGYDAVQQSTLIWREIQSGATGLLVAVVDEQAMLDDLDRVAEAVELVLVESGAGDELTTVSADNYQMGVELADHVAEQSGEVVLLAEGMVRRSVALRYTGFMDRMGELGVEVTELRCPEGEDLGVFLSDSFADRAEELYSLVALDNDLLEAALAARSDMTGPALYGVGTSSVVIHALDQGEIEALVFQNEYAVGYLGIMTLAGRTGLTDRPVTGDIQCRLITRENMFSQENEQLIFSLVD